ncbi:MAG: hypothetical protein KGZ81_07400 [Flavobacteriales bacterium]|nr:hypothetical protein [Flavobacteriales bacterium]
MASTQTWSEFNGAGATETTGRTEANWKRVDDSTTAYTASPINSSLNQNSMPKIQAIKFAGTWNSLSALTYKIDNNAPATGLSIVGAVLAAYVQPATTATGDPAMSTTGLAANFNNSSTPFGAGTSSTTAGGTMFAQALRTQLQTTSSYAGGPGAIAGRTITATWTES